MEIRGVGRLIGAYAAAIGCVGLATGARFLLAEPLGQFESFGPFYPAILASALLGVGPGVLACAASLLMIWYFFLPPTWSFDLRDPSAMSALVVFAACSALLLGVATVHRRVKLARSQADEFFKAIQDISAEGVVLYRAVRDRDGTVVDFEYRYANPAALAIMRQSDTTNIVGKRFLERLPLARAHPQLFPRYLAALKTGQGSEAEYELGGRWFVSAVARLGDGLVVTVQDVSARKRSDEAQKLLLQELNHRVKNVLTSVIAMASIAGRGATSVADFNDKLLGRLHALSRAHGLLMANSWTEAELSEVVRSTLDPHLQSESRRFVIDGPKVPISADSALALNMALYELATNAIKYGALSNPQGEVAVRWRADPNEPGFVFLSWTEAHGPPVQPPGKPGFGTRLLERAFAAEDGEVRLEYRDSGVFCEMRFRRSAPRPSAADIAVA